MRLRFIWDSFAANWSKLKFHSFGMFSPMLKVALIMKGHKAQIRQSASPLIVCNQSEVQSYERSMDALG